MKRLRGCRASRQSGAALLAFALLVVVGASYALLLKINSGPGLYARQQAATWQALSRAKQALLAYALTYPEAVNPEYAPGYLPCPDRDRDGSANDGPCAFASGSTIGRLPFQTLKIPEPSDASGTALWYALADNFRHNPKLEPLNSETPADLRLDGAGEEIAALIIAPGAPLAGQQRAPGEKNIAREIAHYLELDNQDLDRNFISRATLAGAGFNDTVLAITRQELMRSVEGRVLGELARALSGYKQKHGAWPPLGAFADPKLALGGLSGQHRGADNAAILSDSERDFKALGVRRGDRVYNLTDGSISEVAAAPTGRALRFASTMLGAENDFDEGDDYVLFSKDRAVSGRATAGSRGLSLRDSARNLAASGIRLGDVIENLTAGARGIITGLGRDQLRVKRLNGGVNNHFAAGDRYQIRGNYGVAGPGSAGLTLKDADRDFLLAGLQRGDLIWNLTDGSLGRIAALGATELGLEALRFGRRNAFAPGDRYLLPRFKARPGVRQGLLALHAVGEPFQTALVFDWAFSPAAADLRLDPAFAAALPAYRAALGRALNTHAQTGRRAFPRAVGVCLWFLPGRADCYAGFSDFLRVSGTTTAGVNSTRITDRGARFSHNGIEEGAIAQNYDQAARLGGGTVSAANHGTATAGSGGATLHDANNDFTRIGAAPGDTVYNLTDGATGQIQSLGATRIVLAGLAGGGRNSFAAGDEYRIGAGGVLYDAGRDFSAYRPFGHILQKTGGGGRALLGAVLPGNRVQTAPFGGAAAAIFRPGDAYEIWRPRRMVVTAVSGETGLDTTNYTSAITPDFNSGDLYRVLPATRQHTGQVELGGSLGFSDSGADFIALGVEQGDIVKNHAGAYGEISAVARSRITAQLYGGTSQEFVAGRAYTVFHDHAFERRHVLHARFGGRQATSTSGGERRRAVCLGYSAACAGPAAPVAFAGNGGVALLSLRDYQADQTTEVGRAGFTPSAASRGRLKLSNIEFHPHATGVDLNGDGDYLDAGETRPDLPPWFTRNNWHKLIHITYGAGLTLLGEGDTPRRGAALVLAGAEIERRQDSACRPAPAAPQDRVNGTLNEYFEAENCATPGDTVFQKGPATRAFNDLTRGIIEAAPPPAP